MSGAFRDFIPAGENTGAQGSGFRDFVPAPKPVFHPEVVEQTPPPQEVKPSKKKATKLEEAK